MKKSQAPHRRELGIPLASSTNSESVGHNANDDNHDVTFNLKKEDFTKFLKKRQLLQRRALRSKNYSPEMDMRENGVSENVALTADCMESAEDDDDDYIIENGDVSFKNE
jgi:hypothetical protein